MKRVSGLLPPISRAAIPRSDREKEGRKEGRKGTFFYLFATSSHIFGAVLSPPLSPFSSDYDCDVTKDERRLFFPAFYFIAADADSTAAAATSGQKKMTAISQTGFFLANPPKERGTCLFRHCSRKKGLNLRDAEERGQATRMARQHMLGCSQSGAACLISETFYSED